MISTGRCNMQAPCQTLANLQLHFTRISPPWIFETLTSPHGTSMVEEGWTLSLPALHRVFLFLIASSHCNFIATFQSRHDTTFAAARHGSWLRKCSLCISFSLFLKLFLCEEMKKKLARSGKGVMEQKEVT